MMSSQQGFMSKQAITWLHLNHLGAPEAATDAAGAVVWKVRYASSGAATELQASSLDIKLRLPGQYADAETGLHYNRHRYYDPTRGQFLTPDPIATKPGYPDGPNPYVYVRYNPMRYVDPSGLVLFAFDGTGNSNDTTDPAMAAGSGSAVSNVWKFFDSYQGRAYYVAGVGTLHRDSLGFGNIDPNEYANGTFLDYATGNTPLYYNDMGGNYSGPARIDRMMDYVGREIQMNNNSSVMDIDIVGFSRGAAQARDFANRLTNRSISRSTGTGVTYWTSGVVSSVTSNGATSQLYRHTYISRNSSTGVLDIQYRCQRMNFRFMGLFDTVLSVNWSGHKYQLSIPPQFTYVAHAVALNEHRSSSLIEVNMRTPLRYDQHYGGFPLQSIGRSGVDRDGNTRIEMGFIGAHADIGGGYSSSEDQLSFVPANWMYAQARRAGLTIGPPPTIQMTGVVMHDQSHSMRVGDPRRGIPLPPAGRITRQAEDRVVMGAVVGNAQRNMGFGNRSMRNADTYGYINYTRRDPLNPGSYLPLGNTTGSVDMQGYLSELRARGYCIDVNTECARPVRAR
jgi:RHS repeat-associated protein